jgi:sugar/nucleoside kinase (ribokinase family)
MDVGRSGFLCFGTATVDFCKTISEYPECEGLAVIDHSYQSTGGPGLNMAFDLKNLDSTLSVEFIGAIGKDSNGEFILNQCKTKGIDTSRLQISENVPTAYTDAMIESTGGKRTFFYYPGTNDRLVANSIDLSDSHIKILHAGAPTAHKALDQLNSSGKSHWFSFLENAQENGIHTNLEAISSNKDMLQKQFLHLLPVLDSLIINEIEAAWLCDLEPVHEKIGIPTNWVNIEKLGSKLLSLGVNKMVVIHSPNGVVASTKDGTLIQPSISMPRELVKNTTGAGDAVAAGILYGVHENWNLEKSLIAGVCSAAACITSEHTSDGIQPIDQTLTLANEYGFLKI